MQRSLLKYILAFVMIVQSIQGGWAATDMGMMCQIPPSATPHMTMSVPDDTTNAMPDCQHHEQHQQVCVQFCAMLHALVYDMFMHSGAALSVHTMTHIALLTGISHRPLIPPPIQYS